MSLVMKPRNEVEPVEPGFDLVEKGWHKARFEGIGPIVRSTFPIQRGPRKGEYPDRTYFKFYIPSEDREVRTGFFDIDNPHEPIVVALQNGFTGRIVGDDEEFDFSDYEGERFEVWIEHETPAKGKNAGKTFANVTDARIPKKKNAAPPADDFPGDDD